MSALGRAAIGRVGDRVLPQGRPDHFRTTEIVVELQQL